MSVLKYLSYAIPSSCLTCNKICVGDQYICISCLNKFHFITRPVCKQCNVKMPLNTLHLELCERCQYNHWSYDRLISCVYYDGIAAKVAIKLKYSAKGYNFIANMLCAQYKFVLQDIDYILDVPLHWKRLFYRGFNQSTLLADAISDRIKVPVLHALQRRKYTRSQGGLTQKERIKNVGAAFDLSEKYMHQLKGSRVLLVDDVVTTGATVNSIAKVLKKAGVREVVVCSWAKRDWQDIREQSDS